MEQGVAAGLVWGEELSIDATPMPQGDGHTHLGSQDHDVVDGGRARIILTALVTPAEVQEHQPALDRLWWARVRWTLQPRPIPGETTYGTVATIVASEEQGIRASVPLSDAGPRPDVFGEQDFVSDAAADTDRCPGDETWRFLSHCPTTRRRISAAPTESCRTGALQVQGTSSPRGRRVSRSLDMSSLDRVRGYHATEPYAKAMRNRQVWVEPLFAEAKDWHGLRRFRLRGVATGNGEALLTAAGQHLKRLRSRWGWGRRPFPNGAAGIVLPALSPKVALTP